MRNGDLWTCNGSMCGTVSYMLASCEEKTRFILPDGGCCDMETARWESLCRGWAFWQVASMVSWLPKRESSLRAFLGGALQPQQVMTPLLYNRNVTEGSITKMLQSFSCKDGALCCTSGTHYWHLRVGSPEVATEGTMQLYGACLIFTMYTTPVYVLSSVLFTFYDSLCCCPSTYHSSCWDSPEGPILSLNASCEHLPLLAFACVLCLKLEKAVSHAPLCDRSTSVESRPTA